MSENSPNPAHAAANGWPYAVARAPLAKWAKERVTLRHENDHVIAKFVYSGSTCSNMGHPLVAVFVLTLAPNGAGDYLITATDCREGEGDVGCAKMCAYISASQTFMGGINEDHPLNGLTLTEAIAWQPELEFSGCLCSHEGRNHKWRNAVQSIHYALHNASN